MPKEKKSKKTNSKASKTKPSNRTLVNSQPRNLRKTSLKKFPFNKYPFVKKEKPPRIIRKPMPNSFKLFWRSLNILWKHWDLFLGIVAVYGILNIILVKGFATGVNLTTIKADVSGAFHGNIKALGTGFSLFVYLLGGTGNSVNEASGAYQSFLILITSLTIVWALRQVYSGIQPKIRESYYKGSYPLVPVMTIMLIVAVEVIPFALAAAIFSAVIGGGIATTVSEKIITGVLCLGFAVLSFRWLCTSIFALYIATLPDMTPMKALRSARALVRDRRLEVFRKMVFIPVFLLILAAIVMAPIILFITPVAAWAFFLLTMVGLAVIHGYMYTTYREML